MPSSRKPLPSGGSHHGFPGIAREVVAGIAAWIAQR